MKEVKIIMAKSSFTIIESGGRAQNEFGYCYGSETYIITKADIQALLER